MSQINLKSLWDKFTDQYSNLIIHPQYFLKKYNQTAVNLAVKYAKGNLADVGCGRMPYKKILFNHSKIKKYTGIDSPQTSNLYHGQEKPDILADAIKLPFKKPIFDTVLSLQVLEHLPEPFEALKETNRVLKRGGVLILSTIQSYPVHDEPYDFYRYTKYGLKHLLEKTGFKILVQKEDGNVFTLAFQSINVFLMLQLKKLMKKNKKLLAILLTPFVLATTFCINLLTVPFLFFDKNSKFISLQTVVAKKI